MASARQRADQLEQEAKRRYDAARRTHSKSEGRLKRSIQRRGTAIEQQTLPMLAAFEEAISRYVELHFDLSGQREDSRQEVESSPKIRRKDGDFRSMAVGAGVGGGAGGVLAAGTYLGVSTFGAASTGTAIASL